MIEFIGDRIKGLREGKNLTQKELAADFNIKVQAVSSWETKGVKRPSTLKEIADYFGVSVEWLKTGIEKPFNSGNILSNNGISGGSKATNQIGNNQNGLSDEERIELAVLRERVQSLERERDLYKEFYENAKKK